MPDPAIANLPTTAEPIDAPLPGEPAEVPTGAVRRMRPPGEQGGHTVQAWEQPEGMPGIQPDGSSRDTPAPDADVASASLKSDLSPEVVAIYLRPTKTSNNSAVATGVSVVAPQAIAQNETLVDAITRRVLDQLTRSIKGSVEEAVRALAPHMIISLGPLSATPLPPPDEGAVNTLPSAHVEAEVSPVTPA